MQYANLDTIIRRTLLEKGLPIHYYPELLFHGAACVRELTKDTLQLVNTANLLLNDYNAADLPMDFVDEVGVAIPVGNLLHPIAKNDSINPIRVHSPSTGAFTPYSDIVEADGSSDNAYLGDNGWFWFWNVSDWGEPTGRGFGINGGAKQNGYKIVRERRQIQFTEVFSSDNAIISYISNGQSVDNASQIDYRAWAAIQAYIDWKRSPNASFKDSGEARTYYNEKRLLRANMNDLTVADLKQILRKNYYATIKN